jgi:hypothetical protein
MRMRATVRLAAVPGSLSVVVPEGRGVIEMACMVCRRGLGQTKATIAEDDGLVSHGLCPDCAPAYHAARKAELAALLAAS